MCKNKYKNKFNYNNNYNYYENDDEDELEPFFIDDYYDEKLWKKNKLKKWITIRPEIHKSYVINN